MKKLSLISMVLIFMAMIYVNYLSGTGKINHISAGEVSGLYPTYFTPAGYSFSIWGIIYLFNLVFIINAVVRGFSKSSVYPSQKIVYLYFLSCLLNITWIYAWHFQVMVLSMILMILLLISLAMIYREVSSRSRKEVWEYFVTVTPVSLYLGWITVATLANVSVLLTAYHWTGFGIPGHYWASTMIIAAALINILVLLYKKDIYFALVFLWAAMGIISARRADITPESDTVAITGLISMIFVFIFIFIVRFIIIRKERIVTK